MKSINAKWQNSQKIPSPLETERYTLPRGLLNGLLRQCLFVSASVTQNGINKQTPEALSFARGDALRDIYAQ
jgi:hypothetical protein